MFLVDPKDSIDANGWRYRGGGGHIIGESMPGTFGDSERVIHDRDGRTPTYDETDYEVPSHKHRQKETTESNGLSIDELVRRIKR
jgi:hypothetical protein